MCEYCGCQDIPAIGQLTDEHDAIVAVMSQVRSALDAGQVDAAAHWSRRISTLLGPPTAPPPTRPGRTGSPKCSTYCASTS